MAQEGEAGGPCVSHKILPFIWIGFFSFFGILINFSTFFSSTSKFLNVKIKWRWSSYQTCTGLEESGELVSIIQKKCTTVLKIQLQSLPLQELPLCSALGCGVLRCAPNSQQQLCKVDCVLPGLQTRRWAQSLGDFTKSHMLSQQKRERKKQKLGCTYSPQTFISHEQKQTFWISYSEGGCTRLCRWGWRQRKAPSSGISPQRRGMLNLHRLTLRFSPLFPGNQPESRWLKRNLWNLL